MRRPADGSASSSQFECQTQRLRIVKTLLPDQPGAPDGAQDGEPALKRASLACLGFTHARQVRAAGQPGPAALASPVADNARRAAIPAPSARPGRARPGGDAPAGAGACFLKLNTASRPGGFQPLTRPSRPPGCRSAPHSAQNATAKRPVERSAIPLQQLLPLQQRQRRHAASSQISAAIAPA